METNKQWRRMPFDIELAKKIQSGEIEGRIVTFYCGNPVRIITYDLQGSYEVVYAEQGDDKEVVGVCNRDGIGYADVKALVIELPEETPKYDSFNKKLHDTVEVLVTPKHEFKPFDKVLVSQNGWSYWIPSFYRNTTPDGYYICMDNLEYDKCIPYEGNQHLVGTNDNHE